MGLNGVLFAMFHLPMPWAIPGVLIDMFALAYDELLVAERSPSLRYSSAVIGIAVHVAQSLILLALTLSLVLK